jgi:AmmeMemoRadiSam system protein B
MLEDFLKGAETYHVEGNIEGLLVPHAGYRFSGRVAAQGFAAVRGLAVDTVVVIGPTHSPASTPILTTAHDAYQTPLGVVMVDRTAQAALREVISLTEVQNDPFHSIEIELPFLQCVLEPGFSLVPLMLTDQSWSVVRSLSEALAQAFAGKRALFVASSDLSHYYSQTIAHEFDRKMLDCVEAIDPERVVAYDRSGIAFACGVGAIATLLRVMQARNTNHAHITGYATSGDVTGDFEEVVGYGSAIFW